VAALEVAIAEEREHEGLGDAGSEAALRELWISFTSLLRSYFAMLQVVGGETAAEVTGFDPTSFEVRSPRHTLAMRFDPVTGAGTWSLPPLSGTFELLPDGLVKWSSLPAPAEMDQVAETVATMVSEA
jgi:hypothetical protein